MRRKRNCCNRINLSDFYCAKCGQKRTFKKVGRRIIIKKR